MPRQQQQKKRRTPVRRWLQPERWADREWRDDAVAVGWGRDRHAFCFQKGAWTHAISLLLSAPINYGKYIHFKDRTGASLVAQWLRIRLPMQGTRGQALVPEDPTCRGATKPVRYNYWAYALEPVSHNYWAREPQLLSPWATTTEARMP